MLEVMTTLLADYMRLAEELCTQAMHMDRTLRHSGRARFLRFRGGTLPGDTDSDIVILAEPDAYSIMSVGKSGKTCLLQCFIEGNKSVISGGQYADLMDR